tara:strand:+ start:452 stop:598 length:147 start_codon:yes stop_codon:yes gene_type:complete
MLSKEQNRLLKKHSKRHTKKHMKSMAQAMKKGISFKKSHSAAIKKVGK